MSLTTLPPELILEIASYLPSPAHFDPLPWTKERAYLHVFRSPTTNYSALSSLSRTTQRLRSILDPLLWSFSPARLLWQWAVALNRPATLLRLLRDRLVTPDTRQKSGQTMLMLAAIHDQVPIARLLVEAGADVKRAKIRGRETALHFAVSPGMAKVLLLAGADPWARDHRGRAWVNTVHRWGEGTELLELVLRNGGVGMVDCGGDTLLHLAVRGRRKDVVPWLLERGGEVSAVNLSGMTPLQGAGSTDVARMLLNAGADAWVGRRKPWVHSVNLWGPGTAVLEKALETGTVEKVCCKGNTLLHVAVRGERGDVIGWLVEKGADVNRRNNDGETPLHFAGTPGIAETLLDVGADAWALKEGVPWVYAYELWGDGVELLEKALARGNMATADAEGNTLLHMAAKGGRGDVIPWLVERGAELERVNKYDQTPLEVVLASEVSEVSWDTAEALLACGAKPNAWVLHRVAERSDTAGLKMLLKYGADVDGRNRRGMTALHVALGRKGVWNGLPGVGDLVLGERGHEFVKTLLEAGADVNARDRNGNTPLHVAARHLFEEEKRLLIKAGADTEAVNKQGFTPEGAAVRKKPWGVQLQYMEEAAAGLTL